jgi:hypothetical protein
MLMTSSISRLLPAAIESDRRCLCVCSSRIDSGGLFLIKQMQYNIEYLCGHNRQVQLYGPTKDRDRKCDWLKTQKCSDCQRSDQLAANQQLTQDLGLPMLTGTEKQIDYATTIRATVYRQIQKQPDQTKPKLTEFEIWLWAQSSAKWWIVTMEHKKATIDWIDAVGDFNGFFFGKGQPETSWRSYLQKYLDRTAELAQKEIKDAKNSYEQSIFSGLNAALGYPVRSVTVWTHSTDTTDRRIYLDGDLAYKMQDTKLLVQATVATDAIAICSALCQKWQSHKMYSR